MKRIAGLIISVLLFSVLIYFSDIGKIWVAITKTDPVILVFSFLINFIGAVLFNVAQIFMHFSGHAGFIRKKSIVFWQILRIDLVNRYLSLFMPMAILALVRWVMYSRAGINHILGGMLVLMNKIVNFVLIFFFSGLALIFYEPKNLFGVDLYSIFVVALLLFFSFVLLNVLLLWKRMPPMLFAFFVKIGDSNINFLKKFSKKILHSLEGFILNTESNDLRGAGRGWVFWVYFWQVASFATVAYSQLLVINSMGVSLGFVEALFTRSIVLLALMIPISVAGIGFREIGMISVLSLYGIEYETGLAISLVLFLFQILIALIGSVVYFSTKGSLISEVN